MRSLPVVVFLVCISVTVPTSSGTKLSVGQEFPTGFGDVQRQRLDYEGRVGDWDKADALRFLYFSYAAYCPQSELQSWSCKFCNASFEVTAFLSDSQYNTFGYVGYASDSNEIVVAYRGTEGDSLKNWIEDLKFDHTKTPFDGLPGAFVDLGFYQCYISLQAQTLTAVSTLSAQYPSASISVTGHSLGGVISTLAVMDMIVNHDITSVTHYSFGSPRAGDQAFAAAYASLVPVGYRVTNDADIVPHLPPEDFGYFHITTEVWLHNGTITVCSGTNGEDPSCSDSLLLPDSIYDHLHYFGVAEGC